MGNFRHQSLRADERGDGDKDRERGDREGRSYRERDRDRDGHERLRNVSSFPINPFHSIPRFAPSLSLGRLFRFPSSSFALLWSLCGESPFLSNTTVALNGHL